MSDTQLDIERVCNRVRDLLLEKNRKYGDSALEPVRVMSQATPVEQILVRIDDKLSRLSKGAGLLATDEDVITDLIGYFVLLKIALERDYQNAFKEPEKKPEGRRYNMSASIRDSFRRKGGIPIIPNNENSFTIYEKRPGTLDSGAVIWDSDEPWMSDESCGWDPNSGPSC